MRLTGRTFVVTVSAALVFVAAVAGAALLSRDPGNKGSLSRPIRPEWTEARWPFPIDPWGKGKAFRCKAVDCGSEVHVYVRAKLGFCNCTSGIADDEDLAGMGDLSLIGRQAVPVGVGRPITIGSMHGRSRTYSVSGSQNRNETVISIAFNQRCDMVAATVLLQDGASASIEQAVMDFLNSENMLKWAETTLGL
jgi:hypothetical protein